MSKALDSGKALMDAVLAKLPESLRDAAKTAFAAPEATDAITLLGDSALARSDYSKQMDDLREKETTLQSDYERLDGWYKTNKPRLDKVETLEAEIARLSGQPPPTPDPAKPAVSGLSREEIDAIFAEKESSYLGFTSVASTLPVQHFRDFNEVLNVQDLVAYAQKHKLPMYAPTAPSDAYRALFGEKIAAKRQAEEDARVQKLVDDRLIEERKKFTDQPFPLRNQSPSVLDVLSEKDRNLANYSVDAAAAEYERLQSARG